MGFHSTRSKKSALFLLVPSVLFSIGMVIVFPFPTQAITIQASDIPSSFNFTKTLKQGDSVTPDISYLQYILNQSKDTEVSNTGVGSLDNLTNFFGSKTKVAVMKFQEKYRTDILVPANIEKPTGIVGERTRAKLNQILASIFNGSFTSETLTNSNSLVGGTSTTSLQRNIASSSIQRSTSLLQDKNSNSTNVNKNKPIISSFSTFKALSGQIMSLFGVQFHPTKNTVYLGEVNIGDYTSADNGTKITFKVPSNLSTGSYEVGVVNAYGTTSSDYMFLNVVKQDPASSTALSFEPILTSVYPLSSTNLNDIIYIYGDNFSFNNTIETNLGNTVVRSTNRKVLSFMASELPQYTKAFNQYKGQSINVFMKVRNENGISVQQLVHVMRFPNGKEPTVNLNQQSAPDYFNVGSTTDDAAQTAYRAQAERSSDAAKAASSNRASSTSSSGSTGGTSGGNNGGSSSNGSSGVSSTLDSLKPAADPLLEELRSISPVHKFISDPLVKGGSSPSSLFGGDGSSGGSSGGGGFGGGSGGSGGGSGGSTGGSGSVTYFGGQITQVTYCTCSLAILLGINDIPSGQTLQVFYRYGQSTLHANYNIFTSGINVIGGLTQGGGSCEVYSGNSCSSQGNAQYTIDTIRGVGTGMI